MVYKDKDKTIWAQCDNCKIIMLAAVPWNPMTGGEIKRSLESQGWNVGKQCKCPCCNNGQW